MTAETASPNAKANRTRHAESAAGGKTQVLREVAGLELLGEIVMWRAAPQKRLTLDEVRLALTSSGHSDKYAKEFKPETAFTRAARQLSEERLITEVGRTDDEIIFQFTKTALRRKGIVQNNEMTFSLETKLLLDRHAGKVNCAVPELEALATRELDRAMTERSASDITGIVQKLFDDYAVNNPTGCLIPAREQGGAYLVLADHAPFVDRVEGFLNALGGSMNRWPVPKGTRNGDASAARSIEDLFAAKIHAHKEAIESFGVSTRAGTLEEAAKKVMSARFELEAFSHLLGERRAKIEGWLREEKELLIAKVGELAEERKTLPPEGLNQGARIDAFYADGAPHAVSEAAATTGLPEARVRDHCRFCVNKGIRGYRPGEEHDVYSRAVEPAATEEVF